jgi:hypothetical protein
MNNMDDYIDDDDLKVIPKTLLDAVFMILLKRLGGEALVSDRELTIIDMHNMVIEFKRSPTYGGYHVKVTAKNNASK